MIRLVFSLFLFCFLVQNLAAAPLGSGFTYQGQLRDAGALANGVYDFQFELFDAEVGGPVIGSALVVEDVTVSGGVFSVELDFGISPFSGDERWLEIGVRSGDSIGGFTGLLPRQKLTAAPYALHAEGVAMNAIGSAEIANNSVSAADIGANAVGANEIIDSQVQRRVSAICASGNYLVGINEDGSPICEAAFEVVLGSGVGGSVDFVPERFFLTQSFTTSRAGRLFVSVFGEIGMGCSPSTTVARYAYAVINGVPVQSSITTMPRDGSRGLIRVVGATETSVPAGTHEVKIGAECGGDNSWQSTSTLLFSPRATVIVLPE